MQTHVRAARGVCLGIWLCSAATGCFSGSDRPAVDADRYAHGEWDTLFSIGSPEDTLLLLPLALEALNDGVAVADEIARRVQFYDAGGRLVWSTGQKGGGPGEFLFISDIQAADDGTLLVVDHAAPKLVRLDRDGTLLEEQRLDGIGGGLPISVIESGDRYVVMGINANESTKIVTRSLATLPVPAIDAGIPALANRFARATARPSVPGDWVVGFAYGPDLVFVRGDSVTRTSIGVPVQEPWSLGPAKDAAHFGATSLDSNRDRVWAIVGGRPKRQTDPDGEDPRLITVFDWQGTLLDTIALPFAVVDFATADGEVFYFARRDPFPQLLALRWRGHGSEGQH